MICKINKYMTIGLLAITGSFMLTTASTAGSKPPWIVPETGITEAHHFIAARLKKALAVEHRTQPFDTSPRSIKWSTKMRNYGISNIDANNIQKLFSGHYFVSVYRPPGGNKFASTEKISVEYFGNDGKYFTCTALKNSKRGSAWNAFWSAEKISIGFGGVIGFKHKSRKAKWGYPLLYNGNSGRSVRYLNPLDVRSHPTKYEGHFQKEYAPVFKDVCPNIPNNGSVNAKQVSAIYAAFVKDARIIKNIPTRFKQDIDNPLTLGIYFSIYGPDE